MVCLWFLIYFCHRHGSGNVQAWHLRRPLVDRGVTSHGHGVLPDWLAFLDQQQQNTKTSYITRKTTFLTVNSIGVDTGCEVTGRPPMHAHTHNTHHTEFMQARGAPEPHLDSGQARACHGARRIGRSSTLKALIAPTSPVAPHQRVQGQDRPFASGLRSFRTPEWNQARS